MKEPQVPARQAKCGGGVGRGDAEMKVQTLQSHQEEGNSDQALKDDWNMGPSRAGGAQLIRNKHGICYPLVHIST
jgi:hypothetical protein